jgi:elongation factor P
MALSITDLKKGTIFQLDGVPYKVVEYSQKVLGRGGSIVNVKIKSLLSGKVLDKTFKGNEHVEPADITSHVAQFLYTDAGNSYFMDSASFEQHEVANDVVGEQKKFIKEGQAVQLQSFGHGVIAVEIPKNVVLEVTYTESAVKGDTSTSITKDAELETGATVKVPAFIKTGDRISVDSQTGKYRERIKK